MLPAPLRNADVEDCDTGEHCHQNRASVGQLLVVDCHHAQPAKQQGEEDAQAGHTCACLS